MLVAVTTASPHPPLLELDERRRASFGRIGRPEHRRYLVVEVADGTIILTPAVVMSEDEARFLASAALAERVEANRADPSRMIRRRRRP
jgi:hypothetical protein